MLTLQHFLESGCFQDFGQLQERGFCQFTQGSGRKHKIYNIYMPNSISNFKQFFSPSFQSLLETITNGRINLTKTFVF